MEFEEIRTPCYAKLHHSVVEKIKDFPYYHPIGHQTLIINNGSPSINNIYKATIKGIANSPVYEVRREDFEVIPDHRDPNAHKLP